MKLVTTIMFDEKYLSTLYQINPNLVIHPCKTPKEAEPFLAEADIVLSDLYNFNVETLNLASRLKWLQIINAGVDTLPFKELAERKVIVTNMRGIHQIQMSEYVLSMMLQHVRRLDYYRKLQLGHQWESGFIGEELYGKTIGIIGTGSIAREVARKSKVFDMKVIGLNSSGNSVPHFDHIVTYNTIDELLQESDYIVILLPRTKETRHFIRQEHFTNMKPSCYLINIARGDVVNEADLIEALNTGKISGAVLDVFEQEPLPENSPLWDMGHVYITPHHAGVSIHYFDRAFEIIRNNFQLFIDQKPLLNVIDCTKGY